MDGREVIHGLSSRCSIVLMVRQIQIVLNQRNGGSMDGHEQGRESEGVMTNNKLTPSRTLRRRD